MREDLIERLHRAAKTFGDSQAGLLYAEAAAALEAARAYAAVNPLGGPATQYEAIAARIRAGETVDSVLADYGLCRAGELEATREDACVALVADIRFACGDNGKRMQPELVEFIRELAQDAERYRWLRECDSDGEDAVMIRGEKGRHTDELLSGNALDAAIDQARGKGGGEVEGG